MSIQTPYLLFLGDHNAPLAVKMSRAIAHWRPQDCVGEIAHSSNPLTLDLPRLTIDEAREKGGKTFVLGLANSGGEIAESWHPYILEALSKGMDVASGMHQKLSDNANIRNVAEQFNRKLHDVRHHTGELRIGSGQRRSGKRLLTVGTDCSVGKMYTSLAIEKEMKARGFDADFRATGQTGVIISGNGISIDAVAADFISGAVEQISPANADDHWDIIEGQGSLFNPSFAGVSTGLLHGAQPDYLVLCHELGRTAVKDLPHFKIPELRECIRANLQVARLTNPDVKLAGISINCRTIDEREGVAEMARLEQEFSVPCFDPLMSGTSRLVDHLVKI